LNDGTSSNGIQLVSEKEIDKVSTGVSISVIGELINSPAQGQKYELKIKELIIIGTGENYPLSKGKMSLNLLRTMQHLRFRTNTFGAVFRIKSGISFATNMFFHENNYLHLDPNIITTNECEGGAGVFQVTENDLLKLPKNFTWEKDHFDKSVFLTVSSQLQLEAISCALGPVYTTNKSFRSEHSNTSKHLSEFAHLEIENTFIDLEYLMDISEKYIKYVGNYLLKNNLEDINALDIFISKGLLNRIKKICETTFIRIDYSDAIELLKENNLNINFGDDLSTEHETFLTEHFNSPVFVKNWAGEIKPFYMKQNNVNTVANFDLLVPYKVGELIGGSMREENLEILLTKMKQNSIDPASMEWYVDLRRYGTVPHGGFGLGLERLCMLFTGMENIKDTIPFPVSYKNCNY
jgi:asparaginyl-tRNA synthetase